jgi:hypothetical protein
MEDKEWSHSDDGECLKFRVTVHSHCKRTECNGMGWSRTRGPSGYFSITH